LSYELNPVAKRVVRTEACVAVQLGVVDDVVALDCRPVSSSHSTRKAGCAFLAGEDGFSTPRRNCPSATRTSSRLCRPDVRASIRFMPRIAALKRWATSSFPGGIERWRYECRGLCEWPSHADSSPGPLTILQASIPSSYQYSLSMALRAATASSTELYSSAVSSDRPSSRLTAYGISI